jgi:hypothetical protein
MSLRGRDYRSSDNRCSRPPPFVRPGALPGSGRSLVPVHRRRPLADNLVEAFMGLRSTRRNRNRRMRSLRTRNVLQTWAVVHRRVFRIVSRETDMLTIGNWQDRA